MPGRRHLWEPWKSGGRRSAGRGPRGEVDRLLHSRHMVFGLSAQRRYRPSASAPAAAGVLVGLLALGVAAVRWKAGIARALLGRRETRGRESEGLGAHPSRLHARAAQSSRAIASA